MRSGGAGETPNAAYAYEKGACNVATVDDQGGATGISCATSALPPSGPGQKEEAPGMPGHNESPTVATALRFGALPGTTHVGLLGAGVLLVSGRTLSRT